MQRKFAVACAAVVLLSAISSASGVSSKPAFVFLTPKTSSFWHTATNSTFAVPVDPPEGASSATLTVTASGYSKTYPDLPAGPFELTLPEPVSPQAENVYALTLAFDDGTVRTARLGVVAGVGRTGASTRCLFDATSRKWRKTIDRAVLPIPYDTVSLTVDGDEITDFGLDGAQGWYALDGFEIGVTKDLALVGNDFAYTAELLGASPGFLLLFR